MRRYLVILLFLASVFGANTAFTQTLVTRSISTSTGSNCSVATTCAVFGVREMPSIGIYLDVGTTGTFVFEGTIDGTTWFAINDDVNAAGSATVDGAYFFTNPGLAYIRLRASALSGTATVHGFRGFSGLRSTASLSGEAQGDGAVLDGATPAIKATVKDLTNANPIAVAITDANGDQITSIGGGGTTTDPDDASIAGAQTNDNVNALSMAWDGSVWRRLTFGTAGTASTQVLTVQGIASMTPFITTNALITSSSVAGDGSAATATTQFMVGGLASTAAPTWTTGRQVPFSFDLEGGLRISSADLVNIAASTATTATQLTLLNEDLNPDVQHGNGFSALGPQGMLAYTVSPTAVDDTDAVRARGTATGETMTVTCDGAGNDRCATVNASNQLAIAGPVTNEGTFATQIDGAALTALQTIATAVGPSSVHYRTSTGTTEDEFQVSTGAKTLTGGIITNTAATVSYLKCANNTLAGNDVAAMTVVFGAAIPAQTTGAGFVLTVPPGGISFSTGLTCIIVKGAADNDTAEVGANEVKVNLFYK